MVMGRDSHSEGRGFESRSDIFSHIFLVTLVMFV